MRGRHSSIGVVLVGVVNKLLNRAAALVAVGSCMLLVIAKLVWVLVPFVVLFLAMLVWSQFQQTSTYILHDPV